MTIYCPVSGKVSYDAPADGYKELNRRGRKGGTTKKSGHYFCTDCNGYHMVTVRVKKPRR